MIKAVIVDDEESNVSILKAMLKNHCPAIEVVGQADNADDAFVLINQVKPSIVFLDIKMPQKNGFDLLKMFSKIEFEVIFVTAFDKYALTAFEFNALGCILKPIDVDKLLPIIERVIERIVNNGSSNPVLHFVKTLSDSNELINKFSVHHNGHVVFIKITEISSIEANEDSTTLTLFNKNHYYSSKRLAQYEAMLEGMPNFIRISKSVMLNTDYIKGYTKGELFSIEMQNGQYFEVSRRRKAEILKQLSGLITK